MSAFGGLVLTNRGKILQSKAQTGVNLNYTRIALGDGELGSTSILELNALKNQIKTLNISKLKVLGDGKAVVGAQMTNQDLVTGFYFREIGLFATDPDVGEILYCYGNSGDLAEYIPAGGSDIIEKTIDIQTVVGNATNITATIDESSVFATKKDINDISSKELNKGASLVGINDADSYFTSENVEGALKELREQK
ncbi:phage-related tail fiber protein [Sedimentibacter acidaminivorans]|uniref:Phage-related tail fiber protein n=1 Tax=Sedimentibacter acidaminivorans TaxID=913099 RepID=A0ABS4GA69_9FIRM|nr:phage tail protein [Sedimentibacter acidaminivorans]MBP1924583.1 phage-related tail fiber protein [Sedimentibacter acidaminivorans]